MNLCLAQRQSVQSPNAKKSEVARHRPNKAREEGLEETFPASDAIAVVEPAPTAPQDEP
jgi:hypothetical protein